MIAFFYRRKLQQICKYLRSWLLLKKSLKPSRKLRKKLFVQLVKKLPKLDKKTRIKTGDSINKKLPKFNKKTRKKTDYLYFVQNFVQCFAMMKNLQNLARKIGKKTGY